ncbi:unnamed protein product [Parascedosporium putredinis]|uniref:Alpha/gamma-adaptin-binding protein p34 n=1 Tax=Parascedosporium putredinis TaxID=1442378 RepID=A0A9P1H2H3_9PEZI|nr:unnamed protein product [Parascedosporium putredinis]CAI7994947.1 unnamed protein product [Parascedosporium putredinis]
MKSIVPSTFVSLVFRASNSTMASGEEDQVKNIENPRRVLAVSLESASHHLGRVVKEDPEDWAETFLSPEAKEVLDALGGLVLVFEVPKLQRAGASKHDEEHLIEHVGRVVKDGLGGWGWDGVALAIGLGSDTDGHWEDLCAEAGLELVLVSDNDAKGARNEFGGQRLGGASCYGCGNPEKEGGVDENEDAASDSDFDVYGDKRDFEGLRQAILEATLEREDPEEPAGTQTTGGGLAGGEEEINEEDVQKLERMMSKLKAVREMGEGMPEEERRRMARRAVDEVMKEL